MCGYSEPKEFDEHISVPREVIDVIEVPKVVSKIVKVPRVISRGIETPRVVEDAIEISRIVQTPIQIPRIVEEEIHSSRLVHNEVKVPRIVIDHITVTKQILVDEVVPDIVAKVITAPQSIHQIVERPITLTKLTEVPVIREREISVSKKVQQPIRGKKGHISYKSEIVEDIKTETYHTFDAIVVTEQGFTSHVKSIEIPKSAPITAIHSRKIQVPHVVQEIQEVPREVIDIVVHTSIEYNTNIVTRSVIDHSIVTNVEYETLISTRTVIDTSVVTETIYDDVEETHTEFETREQVRTVYDDKTVHRLLQGGWQGCAGQLTHGISEANGVDIGDCQDNCYVKLDHSGNLYRGCYKGETGINPHAIGCTSYGNERWCFCEGNLCNTEVPH